MYISTHVTVFKKNFMKLIFPSLAFVRTDVSVKFVVNLILEAENDDSRILIKLICAAIALIQMETMYFPNIQI